MALTFPSEQLLSAHYTTLQNCTGCQHSLISTLSHVVRKQNCMISSYQKLVHLASICTQQLQPYCSYFCLNSFKEFGLGDLVCFHRQQLKIHTAHKQHIGVERKYEKVVIIFSYGNHKVTVLFQIKPLHKEACSFVPFPHIRITS